MLDKARARIGIFPIRARAFFFVNFSEIYGLLHNSKGGW